MKVYMIRNAVTGEFLSEKYFTTEGSARCKCTWLLGEWWHREHEGVVPSTWEIVEYDLVEAATYPAAKEGKK